MPGFGDLSLGGLEGARLRRFAGGRCQASRIWVRKAWGALGFEDLGLESARLQGFEPGRLGGCQASKTWANVPKRIPTAKSSTPFI